MSGLVNVGDVGRVRVLDSVCPTCRSIVARLTDLDADLWTPIRAELSAQGFIPCDYTSKPDKLKPVTGHLSNCQVIHRG